MMPELGQKRQEAHLLIVELLSLKASEQREMEIVETLDRICPDPEWSDYIYHSDEFCDSEGNMNVDAVVHKIFSYNPIAL